jgi:hypothetical protein
VLVGVGLPQLVLLVHEGLDPGEDVLVVHDGRMPPTRPGDNIFDPGEGVSACRCW